VKLAVVVGNPKPASRTLEAGMLIGRSLADDEPAVVVDAVMLGVGLLGFGDEAVAAAVESVRACDVVVVASPTYKGAYTGVLKAFLDQFPTGGLVGSTAFAVMLGAGPGHALAPEVFLRPVLVELGASCPASGLYLLEKEYMKPEASAAWLESARAHL
jgi:FMN reductase